MQKAIERKKQHNIAAPEAHRKVSRQRIGGFEEKEEGPRRDRGIEVDVGIPEPFRKEQKPEKKGHRGL